MDMETGTKAKELKVLFESSREAMHTISGQIETTYLAIFKQNKEMFLL